MQKKLEETKEKFKDNFEKKQKLMQKIADKTGVNDPNDYNLYIECELMGRKPSSEEAEKIAKFKSIDKFHKYMCKLHDLNQNSFEYN